MGTRIVVPSQTFMATRMFMGTRIMVPTRMFMGTRPVDNTHLLTGDAARGISGLWLRHERSHRIKG